MASETTLRNARIVLEDEVIRGAVAIRDGRITAVGSGDGRIGEDMAGDYLIPGLVELHTDHLEGHYAPRPGVRWNPVAAVLAHDAQVSVSGITTVFDALRVGTTSHDSGMTEADMHSLAEAIGDSVGKNQTRADHFLHLRCEVSTDDCLPAFETFRRYPRLRLVSLMDHAPGQRQFARIEAYSAYYQGKLKLSNADFEQFCTERLAASAAYSGPNRQAIAAACATDGRVLASHDDATADHVNEAVGQGARLAEFPTTVEAARAAHAAGLGVLMGAPNLVRGGSHSGNVSARELVDAGYLDILSSDYIPFSLLQSAFQLGGEGGVMPLPKAINMVARNPAHAVGLEDRGVIAPGRCGDLVRVETGGDVPIVRAVWREGRRVA